MLPTKETQQVCTEIPRGYAVSTYHQQQYLQYYLLWHCGSSRMVVLETHRERICSGIPFHIKCFAFHHFNVNVIQPLSLLLQ